MKSFRAGAREEELAASSGQQHFRLAELIAGISFATDLGMGQPMGHALRTCRIALGIGRAAGFSVQDQADTYYVSLLRFLGCTSEASADAAMNGGDDIALYAGLGPVFMGRPSESLGWMVGHLAEHEPPLSRLKAVVSAVADVNGPRRAIRAHCEVGRMLARRLGLGESVLHDLGYTFERWDGKGLPNGVAGEAIPASCRATVVARDYVLLTRVLGPQAAAEIMTERKGKSYEPQLVDAALEHGTGMVAEMEAGSLWDAVLEAEPGPPLVVDAGHIDQALEAFAHFTDLKSPFLHLHSTGVAQLAADAATAGDPRLDPRLLRRAGLVHDLGRVAVPSGIWNKQKSLSDDEWERVRLHPYYVERILSRCASLKHLAEIASSHHERMDGSGYHRGVKAQSLSPAARLLAAADAFHAMTEERPHRAALAPNDAAAELNQACEAGRMDVAAARAVLEVAGQSRKPGRSAWPQGLTDREVDVLRLLARGASNKQIAVSLTISPKTVGRHLEHIYAKLGVSTRAGATLSAMEHGLVGD